MHFVIVSFYAVHNIGDRILTECVSKLLSKKGISSQIIDIQGRCAFSDTDTVEDRMIKREISARNASHQGFIHYLDQVLYDCSLVLFAGGAILDVVQEPIAKNIFLICNKANNLGIPVAFNAVGFYGSMEKSDRATYLRNALMLPNVKWISVRERASDMELLLGSRKEFTHCCDTAVWAADLFQVTNSDITNKSIGINVVSPEYYVGKSRFSVKAFYIDLFLHLVSSGFSCSFFTNGAPRDYEFAQELIQELNQPEGSLLGFNSFDSHAFLVLLSQYSLIISSRLHTSICSYSLRIPSLCMAWDNKMTEFYEQIGKPGWLIGQKDVSSITQKVRKTVNEKEDGVQKFILYRNTVLNSIDSICVIGQSGQLN